MDVSVIIVNYNTRRLTVECIESIYLLTRQLQFEIIVIDNASSDDSVKVLSESFPEVKLIVAGKNNGFGPANNIGAKAASGKYLFFLNSDTLLINNAIFILFENLKKNADIGIAGGNLIYADHSPAHSYQLYFPDLFFEFLNLWFPLGRVLNRNAIYNYTGKPLEVGYITGADIMISKELFDTIKGFDEDFFMYYEETELTHRVKLTGKKIYSFPDAIIMHYEGGSEKKISYSKVSVILKSKKLFYKKVYGNFQANLLFIYQIFVASVKQFLSTIMGNKQSADYWKCYLKASFNIIFRK